MRARPYRSAYARGEITVFLSLILSGLLGLAGVLIESARLQLIRMKAEAAMDAGLHSCFGEYDQRLYKSYDLLFIDSSYKGTEEAGIDNVARHLAQYMVENTDCSDTGATGEWYGETVTDAEALRYVFASDGDGEVLKSQAAEYMEKYGKPKYMGTVNANKAMVEGIKGCDLFGEWDALLGAISAYGLPLTNPGEIVRGMVLSEDEYLTGVTLQAMRTGDVPSKRGLKRGNGMSMRKKPAASDDMFIEYLMQKCGCYTGYFSEQQLTAELEYMICGEGSDRDNMCMIVRRLLELRESDNLSCIRSDAGKVMLAEEKAYEVAAFNSLLPPDPVLVKLIRDSIICAWAYAESAIDVSRLLVGGRCPARKGSADIGLALDELLDFRSRLNDKGGSGIGYKEYLGIFLCGIDDRVRRLRCMDIIEGNFRVFYNDGFRMDGCVEYLEAEVALSSGYGYSHTIKRDLIYE